MPENHSNTSASQAQTAITITLLRRSDNSQSRITASPQLRIGAFLEQILNELAQGENGDRIRQLRECYEPVLELLIDGEGTELDNNRTLSEAGVGENAICQIAARPLKKKMMFCRYASQA
jgi:hypothetical protein